MTLRFYMLSVMYYWVEAWNVCGAKVKRVEAFELWMGRESNLIGIDEVGVRKNKLQLKKEKCYAWDMS